MKDEYKLKKTKRNYLCLKFNEKKIYADMDISCRYRL